jgi:hypothetical protein
VPKGFTSRAEANAVNPRLGQQFHKSFREILLLWVMGVEVDNHWRDDSSLSPRVSAP